MSFLSCDFNKHLKILTNFKSVFAMKSVNYCSKTIACCLLSAKISAPIKIWYFVYIALKFVAYEPSRSIETNLELFNRWWFTSSLINNVFWRQSRHYSSILININWKNYGFVYHFWKIIYGRKTNKFIL